MPHPLRVAFLAGLGRSGSTLLGRILGGIPNFVYLGEVYRLWDRIRTRQDACGCREHLAECPFWKRVFEVAFSASPEALAGKLAAQIDGLTRARHFPAVAWGGLGQVRSADLGALRASLGALYRGVSEVSGAAVLVDSSKQPTYARVLTSLEGIDLRVVHVVRDPRGVAHSWARSRSHPVTGVPMVRISWLRSAAIWLGNGLLSEAILPRGLRHRYLRVRYEDFIAHPRETVGRVLAHLGADGTPAPHVGDRRVSLGPSHSVSGNPNRFDLGEIALRPDMEWRTAMPAPIRKGVAAICWPVMLRYGYL
jgi:hypothetical protein